jgi:diguanylate cyclase
VRTAKDISESALDFLADQRLEPSPKNYRIAFAAHEKPESAIGRAVAELTEGGVRITQARADEIYARFLDRAAAEQPAGVRDAAFAAIRHQALRLADLATSASALTGGFNRDLEDCLPDIENAETVTLAELVIATLARSQRAEEELKATSGKVEQLREELESVREDAERDALTGLPNRRGIQAQLPAVKRKPGAIFVALCDLDSFKTYNDRYGHAVGDRVLKAVAASLNEALPGCIVGRWGGEEFLIIGSSELQKGLELLEHAKNQLGNRQFKLRDSDEPLGRITFSAGVTALAKHEDFAAAVERADRLLYQAKGAGRDRVFAG